MLRHNIKHRKLQDYCNVPDIDASLAVANTTSHAIHTSYNQDNFAFKVISTALQHL